MLRLNKILVPVDFSDSCALVLPLAADFAKRFGAEITLLHAAPLFPDRAPDPLCARLDQFGALHLIELKAHRHLIMTDRDIGQEITTYAHKHHIDLIMMATHGYGPFRAFLLGSVTLKVLHDAACPVWTSAHIAETPDLRHICIRSLVCAIDRSEHSCRPLKWAGEFAGLCRAKLTIVHAIPSMAATLGEFSAARWEEEMREQVCL